MPHLLKQINIKTNAPVTHDHIWETDMKWKTDAAPVDLMNGNQIKRTEVMNTEYMQDTYRGNN